MVDCYISVLSVSFFSFLNIFDFKTISSNLIVMSMVVTLMCWSKF